MPVFVDRSGTQVVVGTELARGGEAAVHEVRDRPDLVAKLYSPSALQARPDQERKLTWMIARPPSATSPNTDASIAWPQELLYAEGGQFAGFLMPRVTRAVPIFEVFNPGVRNQNWPGFDWRFLHRTAFNLATALSAVHGRGYVIGDINDGNILVSPNATVMIIDADSFQVRATEGGTTTVYRCRVGRLEYTPPELQGASFGEVEREPRHDRFALAVLIFQLLLDGSHPFRSRWLAEGEPMSIGDKIREGYFPYREPILRPIAPPPNAPGLDALHPDVARLFRVCFVDGHDQPERRPTPDVWKSTLRLAEVALKELTAHRPPPITLANSPWRPTITGPGEHKSAGEPRRVPPVTTTSWSQADYERERHRAALVRSYHLPAFLTLLLYLPLWLPGFIVNLVYWRHAVWDRELTGRSPQGNGCLVVLLILFGIVFPIGAATGAVAYLNGR